jgi:uncharacterized protein DUF4440
MKLRFLVLLLLSGAAIGQHPANPLGGDPAKFDEKVEAASLHNDLAFFQTVLSDDVRFTHGTGLVQDKAKWLADVPQAKYAARDLDSVEVEPHSDIVETTGHIHVKIENPRKLEYQIWYVRVYARRDGRWQLLSNRTVRQVNGRPMRLLLFVLALFPLFVFSFVLFTMRRRSQKRGAAYRVLNQHL